MSRSTVEALKILERRAKRFTNRRWGVRERRRQGRYLRRYNDFLAAGHESFEAHSLARLRCPSPGRSKDGNAPGIEEAKKAADAYLIAQGLILL